MSYAVARQYERVPVLLDVVWEGTAGKYEARTVDISMGGCYVDTLGQSSVGETISFKAHLPSGQWVPLEGEVVYQQWPTGFGLRFTKLSEEAQNSIAQLVASYRGHHT